MFEPPQGSTDNDGGPGSAWTPRAPQLHPAPLISTADIDFLHPSAETKGLGRSIRYHAKLESPCKTNRHVIGTVMVRTSNIPHYYNPNFRFIIEQFKLFVGKIILM